MIEELPIQDFFSLKKILEKQEKCKVKMSSGAFGRAIDFKSSKGTSIYIRCNMRPDAAPYLTLASIELFNRRIGTGTMILNFLKQYGKEKGFAAVMIESVCTEEMYSFCLKHNFTKISSSFLPAHHDFFGNYLLELN